MFLNLKALKAQAIRGDGTSKNYNSAVLGMEQPLLNQHCLLLNLMAIQK